MCFSVSEAEAAPVRVVVSAASMTDGGGDNSTPIKSAASAGTSSTRTTASDAPTKPAPVRRRQTGSSSGGSKGPSEPGADGLNTLDNSEEMVQAIFNAILYQAHMEVRGPTSLPFSGNSAEGARSFIDAGTSLYLVGTELQGIAKDIIRVCLADDCPFALQLTSFYHKDVPWVCLGIWIPMRPTCMRVLMKATQLSKLCTAGSTVISAETEIEIVRLVVRDFLNAEKLTAKRLVSVTCRLAPNSWSFYEQAENSTTLDLKCIIPPELNAEDLQDWFPSQLQCVRRFLEDLSCLATMDLYLGRMLSSFGCLFGNLPSRISILYWPFVARAVSAVVRSHGDLSRLLATGTRGPKLGLPKKLIDQLDSSGFLEACTFVENLVRPLGKALERIAEAEDTSDFLAPVIDFLNWLESELGQGRNSTYSGVCWEDPGAEPDSVPGLALDCVRDVSWHRLDSDLPGVEAIAREALSKLRAAWIQKWNAVLNSAVMQVLLLPNFQVGVLLEHVENLNAWISRRRGRDIDLSVTLESLAQEIGSRECLGIAWEKCILDLPGPLGTMCAVALVANRYVFCVC